MPRRRLTLSLLIVPPL